MLTLNEGMDPELKAVLEKHLMGDCNLLIEEMRSQLARVERDALVMLREVGITPPAAMPMATATASLTLAEDPESGFRVEMVVTNEPIEPDDAGNDDDLMRLNAYPSRTDQ